MLNAQTGEITWSPKMKDLGMQKITVNVSDGITTNKQNQIIQIFVYALPKFIKGPPKESYVNIEYNHTIEAEDGWKQRIPEEDIYITIEKTTLENISFNSKTYQLTMVPTIEQAGSQEITLELKDNYKNTIKEKFIINVLISPCDTADSLYYSKTQKLEKKVNEYEKVIQVVQNPEARIDTLYSINYTKREMRKKAREERREKRKKRQTNQKRKEKFITKTDTIFITEYDTLYKTVTDTIYNKIKQPKEKTPIKEKQTEENKTEEKSKDEFEEKYKGKVRLKKLDANRETDNPASNLVKTVNGSSCNDQCFGMLF
jgi:hypothetical protein